MLKRTCSSSSFPVRLLAMLQDASILGFDDIITWQQPGGESFKIIDSDRLVSEIMPIYFPETTSIESTARKFKSFQRQLRIHGFQQQKSAQGQHEEGLCKVVGWYYWRYSHPLFNNANPKLLLDKKEESVTVKETLSSKRTEKCKTFVQPTSLPLSSSGTFDLVTSSSENNDNNNNNDADNNDAVVEDIQPMKMANFQTIQFEQQDDDSNFPLLHDIFYPTAADEQHDSIEQKVVSTLFFNNDDNSNNEFLVWQNHNNSIDEDDMVQDMEMVSLKNELDNLLTILEEGDDITTTTTINMLPPEQDEDEQEIDCSSLYQYGTTASTIRQSNTIHKHHKGDFLQ